MIDSIKKYWALLLPRERWHLYGLLGFMIFNGLVELIGVAVVPLYVRLITEPRLVTANKEVLSYWPQAAELTIQEILIYGGITLFLIYIGKTAVMIMNHYFQERFIRGRQMRISSDLFRKYLEAPLTFHLQRNTAELIRNTQTEVQKIGSGLVVPLLQGGTQLIIALLMFISIIWVNPMVSLLTLFVLGAAVFIYNQVIRKKIVDYRARLQHARGNQIKAIHQGLGGIKEVKVLQRTHFFYNVYRDVLEELRKGTIFTQMAGRANAPYLEFIALMGMLLIAISLAATGTSAELLAPIIAFYGVAMFRLKQSVTVLMTSYTTMKIDHISIHPVYKDMVLIPAAPKIINNQKFEFKESLDLDGIHYTYPNTSKPALYSINLSIQKGTSIGLVGTTGAGKTTLVDVILGLLKPQKGRVMVDGQDIFSNLPGWHRQIGYIPQQIYLLDDTIRANIAFGITAGQIDDNQIWQALKAAQLADFVKKLPEGLDTITGERGIRLSGGQRQRIGIARALYHRPSVLVMDEATASLDNETEKKFVAALEAVKQEHTMIIIAHRLTTIEHCDQIVLMENGTIKAIDTFQQLLATEKLFQSLAG